MAPLHTAGPVAATPDAAKLLTCVNDQVLLTDLTTGFEICRFAGVNDFDRKKGHYSSCFLGYTIGHLVMRVAFVKTLVCLHIIHVSPYL